MNILSIPSAESLELLLTAGARRFGILVIFMMANDSMKAADAAAQEVEAAAPSGPTPHLVNQGEDLFSLSGRIGREKATIMCVDIDRLAAL